MKDLYASDFRLADDDQYDEIEEEVVERDEEYDDEDEGYDDEGYEDEEYDDEYADEEEPYEDYDDGYEDGYDDQYYDDRLNRVLEEIADIKRGMATPPAVVQQPPVYPPQNPTAPYVYTNNATPNGGNNGFNSEVVMYNEISRLRDELSKTQNTQALHMELSRLREDMEREQRAKEERYQDEIRRLNEKIEGLQKNELGPQSDNNGGYLSAGSEGTSNGAVDVDKLLSINEAILMNAKNNDSRVMGELNAIKDKLSKLPDFDELNKSVSIIRRAAKNGDPALAEQVAKLRESIGAGNPNRLETQLSAVLRALADVRTADSAELFRQVYTVKQLIGAPTEEEEKRNAELLALYNDLAKAKFTVASQSASFVDKFQAVAEICGKISSTEQTDLGALVAGAAELSDTVAAVPVDKDLLETLSQASSAGTLQLPRDRYEAALSLFEFVERIKKEDGASVPGYLPDLIAASNTATSGLLREENEKRKAEITELTASEDKKAHRQAVDKMLELTAVTVGELIDIPRANPPRSFRTVSPECGQALFDKLDELKKAIEQHTHTEAPVAMQDAPVEPAEPGEQPVIAAETPSEQTVAQPITVDTGVFTDAVEGLRAEVRSLAAASDLDGTLEELKKDYVKILDMLSNMNEMNETRPTAPVVSGEDGDEEAQFSNNDLSTQLYNVRDELLRKEQESTGLTQEYVDIKLQETAEKLEGVIGEKLDTAAQAVEVPNYDEDLAFIKTRLDDWDMFITQIADLRSDILTASESSSVKEQLDKLYEDIVPQFDKLYEDLASVVATSEGNLTERVNQSVVEINAAVDAINETLATATGSTGEMIGAIGDLRADVSELAEKVGAGGVSADDIAKLSDEVGYIREQLEVLSVDENGNSDVLPLRDRLLDDLELVNARLGNLETVLVGNEEGSSLADRILTVGEQVKTIDETTNNILAGNLDFQTSVYDDLTFIKSKLAPDENTDNLAAVLDDLQTAIGKLDALSQASAEDKAELSSKIDDIKEQLHLKDLEPSITNISESEEERSTLLAEIAEIRERLVSLEDGNGSLRDTVEVRLGAMEETVSNLNTVTEKVNEIAEKADAAAIELGTLALINDDLAEIKNRLADQENTDFDNGDTATVLADISAQVNDLTARLDENAVDLQNLSLILQEIEELKSRLDTQVIDDGDESAEGDALAAILEDVGVIKEKVSAEDEYDVVAEILSLREEVKAARIVDQNDISDELEAVRTDILERYNTLLEEIKTLREELGGHTEQSEAVAVAPTSDELNMVLGEIVSLRDEVQAYKDEITAFAEKSEQSTDGEGETVEPAAVDETTSVILDELTNLRAEFQGYREEVAENRDAEYLPLRDELDALRNNLDDVKDMIARRTTLAETEEGAVPASNELNVVLDEIINIKDELDSVHAQIDASIRNEVDRLAEQLPTGEGEHMATEDEFLDRVRQQITDVLAESLPDFQAVTQEIEQLKNQVADLQLAQLNAVTDDAVNIREDITALREELRDGSPAEDGDMLSVRDDIAALLDELRSVRTEPVYAPTEEGELLSVRDEIANLLDEVRAAKAEAAETASLQEEIAALKEAIRSAAPVAAGSMDEAVLNELTALRQELTGGNAVEELRAEIAALKEELSAGSPAVMTEVMALRDEVVTLKEQLAGGVPTVESVESVDNSGILDELAALREEIAAWKETAESETPQAQESDYGVMAEILALRDEFQEFKNGIHPDDSLTDSLETIRTDVQSLRDEPDLGVMREILALRDEFQAMKEQIHDAVVPTREEDAKSNEEVLNEVQSLRDQLFAISMANVNDGANETYESYNNIILDEITALRDEITAIKASNKSSAIMDEVAAIKEKLSDDTTDRIVEQLGKLKADFEGLQQRDALDATNNAILSALDNLKEEIANQREADVTTLNFMAEMAHLLERQNQYINQNSNEKLTDEIESLKAEIASSLNAPNQQASKLMDEIAALKDELSQSLGESVVIDNQAILDELAALKEEISKENPTNESQLVLNEISRLKDEISAIAEKEKTASTDTRLSQSISDLKNELSQIADLVTDEQKPAKRPTDKPSAKTSSKSAAVAKPSAKKSTKSTGKKSGGKSGTRKTAKKAEPTPEPKEEPDELSADALISRIESATLSIPQTVVVPSAEDFNPALDFSYQPSDADREGEDMDVASRLAKQVANKLIMEQLVEQLGDGGVSSDKVDEIVRDILPQEFNTVAINEQSDRVRRLANSLVLDKLRARLKGKKPE